MGVEGPHKELLCDYENVDFLFSDEVGIPVTDLFSSFRNKQNYDLFLFLSKHYIFSKKESLSILVDKLWNDEFSKIIAGVYADVNIVINGKEIPAKYHHSFNLEFDFRLNLMNIPFMIRSGICPVFNNQLKEIFLYDALLKLSKEYFLFHSPHCLFSMIDFDKMNSNIATEINLINETNK